MTPSFCITRPRWTFTVFSAVPSSPAICLFSMPVMTSCITSNSRGVSKSRSRRVSSFSALRRRCSADRIRARSTHCSSSSSRNGFRRKSTAPAFIACAHIGISPWPVINTSCSSRRCWIRVSWRSIPLIPGICTSTITHEGPLCNGRARKSDADSKISLLYPAERSNRATPFRTDASSSIAKTKLFGGIIIQPRRLPEE